MIHPFFRSLLVLPAALLIACASPLQTPEDEAPLTPSRASESSSGPISLSIEPVDLHLQMKPLDSEVIFKKEPYDRSSFPVLVAIDGSYVPGKTIVSGSFTRIFPKKSLRITLDGSERWFDNRRISLDAMATDPSYIREWAAWDLAHSLGMAGPITRMVRVHLNGDYIGPFMAFDWIDPAMLERRGLGGDGILHHPLDSAYCGAFEDPSVQALQKCWLDLSRQSGNFSELSALGQALNEASDEDFHTLLEQHFDVDSVINWIVLNTITSNTDTYNKNYFLYFSRVSEKWIVIPWDYDLAFGRNADPVLPYPQTILNDNFQYFYTPELGNYSPLKEKTLSNPVLYERFKQRLAHVLGEARDPRAPESAYAWFHPERFRPALGHWGRTLLPEVGHDQYSIWSFDEFMEHVEALDYYNLARHSFLTHQVLGTTVFNTPRWLPYRSYPFVDGKDPFFEFKRFRTPVELSSTVVLQEAEQRVVAIDDSFSRPLGFFVLGQASDRPVRLRVEAETERPPQNIPPGHSVEQCIERSWFLDIKTPDVVLQPLITLEYLEESSLRHEVGAGISDQRRISFWAFRNNGWTHLPTHSNPVSKTLTTQALSLRSGEVTQLLACADLIPTPHDR